MLAGLQLRHWLVALAIMAFPPAPSFAAQPKKMKAADRHVQAVVDGVVDYCLASDANEVALDDIAPVEGYQLTKLEGEEAASNRLWPDGAVYKLSYKRGWALLDTSAQKGCSVRFYGANVGAAIEKIASIVTSEDRGFALTLEASRLPSTFLQGYSRHIQSGKQTILINGVQPKRGVSAIAITVQTLQESESEHDHG